MNSRIMTLMLCCMPFVCCSNGGDTSEPGVPAMNMTIVTSNSHSVTLDVKTVNADHTRFLCEATTDPAAQTAQSVAEKGEKHTNSRVVIDELSPMTTYTIFAVACDKAGKPGTLQHVQFTTDGTESEMYAWEQARTGILSFTDLVLCYGGSTHRNPYLWEKDRFAPFVAYKDRQNKEHWMFDSFLCIEFVFDYYSLNLGQQRTSAGRTQWEGLIDYWFRKNNGVNALEEAVKEAAGRLGTPPSKRKVIMVMPDPIIYKEYADEGSSTKYWGVLNGRQMDFSKAEDRIAVYKWYINEVRKRFNEANYQYIELAGFYIVSEDLATPGDGWNPELKKWEEVIPSVAAFLHGVNESLCWIPYFEAAGYKRWSNFGIDYAYMQPNYFWNRDGKKSLPKFFADIKSNDLAMEFEFDEALLASEDGSDVYRARFREYMSGAKENGVYGTKPLAYYHGTNAFYDLSVSTSPIDQELYHEFCQFVIDNPLRK